MLRSTVFFQGNGYISRDTLKALLKEIASDLSDSQLDEAVDEIDEDGSGKIEFAGGEIFWGKNILHTLNVHNF